MKFLKSHLLLLSMVMLFAAAPESPAQQKRTTKTPRKVSPNPTVPAITATFDTLLASDVFKIYVEVRGVGQVIRSSSVNELLDPVMKLAAPPKEFKKLIKWLDAHADVMTSRMFFATWPTANNVPDLIFAIEFDSPEEAAKFATQLNSFLPEVLPTNTTQPATSPDEVKKRNQVNETAPVNSPYHLKQIGSLVLITPTPLTLKNLRPTGSKLLTDDVSFRVARTRFNSEQVFVYVDVNGIEKEEEKNRKRLEEERIRTEEAKRAAENSVSTPTVTDEEKNAPTEDVGLNPAVALSSPDVPATPPPEPDPVASAVGLLANSFFSGQTKWPDAIGIGVSFENDSFDVRALMVTATGEKSDAIPFFPNLIPGASIVPESHSILPADTELFAMLSLDLPQIYAAMSKPRLSNDSAKPEFGMVKDKPQLSPFAEIENRLKINLKEDLLPLLGSEIVVSMPMKFLEGGPLPGPNPTTTPSDTNETEQKPMSSPGFVVALSLRDREGMKALLPRIVDSIGFKGASAFAQTERREDTELISYGSVLSYAFIGNFLVISTDSATTRHVVDSYLKHETLASDSQFKNYTRWQPRQLQAQLYVSPALMESYKSWVDQPSSLISEQTRDILSRLSLLAQPITYSLSNDGLGTLHELHVPKNLLLMAVAGISAETNPSPIVANERAAIGALYMIANVENQYRAGKGTGSFGTIEQLRAEGFLSEEMMNQGYRFELTLIGSKFEVTATPAEYGKTGKTSYYIDDTNVLRGADHGGGMASSADRPIQ